MANFNIDYLVIAGGGGGASASSGNSGGGAGGAGGYRTSYGTGNISGGNSPVESALNLTIGTSYTITVGDGGAGGPAASPINRPPISGTKGDNSVFASITSEGGGYGEGANLATSGGSGGSAGGGGGGSNGGPGGTGTSSQGSNGGTGTSNCASNACYLGGGGGGASQAGSSVQDGKGGDGLSSSITGSSVIRAGGGSGGSYGPIGWNDPIAGGAGGGGAAGVLANGLVGQPGTTNTGGGGGGATWYTNQNSKKGGDGGSGIVILRYATTDVSSYTTTGITPTEDTTTIPGQTILSFTTVGTSTIAFTAPPPPPFSGTKVTTPVTDFNKPNTKEGLKIPSGTSSNQPTGFGSYTVDGMIRNDTTISSNGSSSAITYYNGTNWRYFAATESPDGVYPTSLKMYLDASDTTSYPGTGTTWFDLTSNANNGTILDATWNSGGYFTFDGSGDYINLAQNILSTTPIASFSLWAKGSTLATNTTQYKIIYNNANGGFFFALLVGSGNLEVYTRNSSAANIIPISYPVSNFNANDWYNIAVTFSGLNSAVNLYVNSVLVDTGTFPTTTIVYTQYYNAIGGDPASGAAFTMVGSVSKVKTYNITLTQAEVTALYNEGR